jgi:hypothetical protein
MRIANNILVGKFQGPRSSRIIRLGKTMQCLFIMAYLTTLPGAQSMQYLFILMNKDLEMVWKKAVVAYLTGLL